MKMNGMSCDVQFMKKADGYIHYMNRTITSDLPNQYDHDDVNSNFYSWFLALVPGYKYTINVQGIAIVKQYKNSNPVILATASHDNVVRQSLNGKRTTLNAGQNVVNVNNDWQLSHVVFHNSGIDINDIWTGVTDTPYSNDCGVTFTIENKTDKPYCIFIEHYGFPFLLSDYTTTAVYYKHAQILIENVKDSSDNLVMDRYAGYHDKNQMMHYLNAYWTTYDLYLNSLMWNEDTLTPFFWKDIYEQP